MEDGFANILTDELKVAIRELRGATQDMFKGTRPYRRTRMSNEEAVARYMVIPEEQKMQLRQNPDFNLFEQEVQKIMEGYNG